MKDSEKIDRLQRMCAICGEKKAEQGHHITPDIQIEVCVDCHRRLHNGKYTGEARGYTLPNRGLVPPRKGGNWAVKSFSINIAELDTTWKDIQEIAQRENASASSIVVKALRAYAKEHKKGNFQTKFASYVEGGDKSDGQIVQEVVRFFVSVADSGREVHGRDILDEVRRMGFTGEQIVSCNSRIGNELKTRGVTVIR